MYGYRPLICFHLDRLRLFAFCAYVPLMVSLTWFTRRVLIFYLPCRTFGRDVCVPLCSMAEQTEKAFQQQEAIFIGAKRVLGTL
jgi:hypothetical protein